MNESKMSSVEPIRPSPEQFLSATLGDCMAFTKGLVPQGCEGEHNTYPLYFTDSGELRCMELVLCDKHVLSVQELISTFRQIVPTFIRPPGWSPEK